MWYAIEGDWGSAGLSFVGAVPIVGDVSTGVKIGGKAVTHAADAISAAGKGAKAGKTVEGVASDILQWLGEGARFIKNSNGDTVIVSQDGLRRVRFDINNPWPHSSQHAHVEELVDGNWIKSGPIYPKDVPQR